MGGNAEENTAFRPMCFGTGAEGFCVIFKEETGHYRIAFGEL